MDKYCEKDIELINDSEKDVLSLLIMEFLENLLKKCEKTHGLSLGLILIQSKPNLSSYLRKKNVLKKKIKEMKENKNLSTTIENVDSLIKMTTLCLQEEEIVAEMLPVCLQ